jgi:hypothetical protein
MQEAPPDLLTRFQASMTMDLEKWRDGIGYDLELLKSANAQELAGIECLLTSKPVEDWRDVEALAALGTERAHQALRGALDYGEANLRLAIARYAPGIAGEKERAAALVTALETAPLSGGLSAAIDDAAEFHPPEVVAALWRGIQKREGEAACHFAATLYYIYGLTDSPFDLDSRDFFLRFNTTDPAEREAAYAELCERVGIVPSHRHE